MSTLFHPAGSLTGAASTDLVDLTPEKAGWAFSGLRVVRLEPGVPHRFSTGGDELFVLPMTGGALTVEAAGERFEVTGRATPFARVTDFVYVGRDTDVVLASAEGAEVALPASRCERRLAPKYGAAEDVPVEIRGTGPATRQVNAFGVPGHWEHADKLIAVELITPDGNWSSYPPHKHDVTAPCPVVNEEIYYYRIAGADQVTPSRVGFGLHQTYTGPEHDAAGLAPLAELVEVRDGDVVNVPYGYHGPCVAAPGYPMYYLNVMSGPGERAVLFCDDPAHAWVRGGWEAIAADPRCPVTDHTGRLAR